MKPNRLSSESQQRIRELIPNYGSLTDKEVVLEAAKVILKDFYLFTEKNLMITDKDGQLIPLRFKWAQKRFVEAVMEDLIAGRPVRYIILKARQMGFSTVIEALCYWWTTTHNNVSSVIIAHKKAAAKNLYKMFRRFYTNCDQMFRPVMKYNTKDDLTFDVSDEVKAEYESRGQKSPGLSSEIQTMVAAEGGGRSSTIHFFHGCLHEDSLVVLSDGSSKLIKDIELGDTVYTSSGAIAPVSFKTMTGVKQTYKLNSWMTNEPIIASADHKILTIDGYKKMSELTSKDWVAKPKYRFEHKDEWTFELPERKRPQNGGTRRETKKTFVLGWDFGYLAGYYLAEGHVTKNLGRVSFAYEKSETFVRNIDKFFPNPPINEFWEDNNRGVTTYNSVFMASMLNELCGRVADKHVPLFGNDDFYQGMMQGYLDGDGSKTDVQRVRATSVHEKIARNINRLGDCFGNHGSLHYSKRERYGVETKDVWTNSFCHGKSSKYKFVDKQCFVRVKTIEEYEVAKTYDLEIDHPDHNFETPGGIVSNSECAFWDAGADVLSSALQAIPLRANTFAFLESTANGIGGYFYDEWQNAKKGDSIFKPMFFAWHEDPEYAIDNGQITEYTEEEEGLLKIFEEKGYPREEWDKKIHFWRVKKQEFRSRPDELYQEYPKNDIEAFLASGRSKFDKQALMKMEEVASLPENQPKFGLLTEKDRKVTCKLLEATESDPKPTPLKVWELPQVGHRYVMGVDTSEGIAGGATGKEGDYSVIDIMDVENLKTVARWRGHIDPDLLGDLCVQLGTYYNWALIGPEINNHGLTTTQRIRDKFYRNLFMRESSEEEQFQERTSKMGWKTDRKTKPLMINDLAAAIRENDIIDLDIVFIRECITYVVDDQGRTNAQEGMFDDTVMAKAISLQLAQWSHLDTDKIKVVKKQSRNGSQKTRASKRQNPAFKVSNNQGYQRTKATRSGKGIRGRF